MSNTINVSTAVQKCGVWAFQCLSCNRLIEKPTYSYTAMGFVEVHADSEHEDKTLWLMSCMVCYKTFLSDSHVKTCSAECRAKRIERLSYKLRDRAAQRQGMSNRDFLLCSIYGKARLPRLGDKLFLVTQEPRGRFFNQSAMAMFDIDISPDTPKEIVIDRLSEFQKRRRPSWGFRIYETPNGLHVFVTSHVITDDVGRAEEAMFRLTREFGADDLYHRLSWGLVKSQESKTPVFSTRLTPKDGQTYASRFLCDIGTVPMHPTCKTLIHEFDAHI